MAQLPGALDQRPSLSKLVGGEHRSRRGRALAVRRAGRARLPSVLRRFRFFRLVTLRGLASGRCGFFSGVFFLFHGLGAFSGLGVLVGLSMYLPIIYILTYGIGCVINMGVCAVKGKTWAEEWGVPFSAGLIVGEAVLSLIINAVVLMMG